MTYFSEIRQKVELLKKYDTSYTVFGAKKHRYEFNSTLSEDEIVLFEKKEHLKLPEDYCNYLKYLGNGGVGPAYGLYSLEEARNGAGWYLPIEINNEFSGELLISHLGCGLFNWLKINGEIWYDGTSNGSGVYCVSSNFMEWYENWLDSAFLESGFIAHLGYEALELGQKGLFTEALDLFKLGVNIKYREHYKMKTHIKTEYLKMFCNVLYFLQNDNTGLPVNTELNKFFLEKCLPYGIENPAIYFNAACVYTEMNDFHDVVECIKLAKEYYDGYETMMNAIEQEDVFAKFRESEFYSKL